MSGKSSANTATSGFDTGTPAYGDGTGGSGSSTYGSQRSDPNAVLLSYEIHASYTDLKTVYGDAPAFAGNDPLYSGTNATSPTGLDVMSLQSDKRASGYDHAVETRKAMETEREARLQEARRQQEAARAANPDDSARKAQDLNNLLAQKADYERRMAAEGANGSVSSDTSLTYASIREQLAQRHNWQR